MTAALQQKPTPREEPALYTRAAVVPASLNEEARTVEVAWTTGAEVVRTSFWTGERYVEALSLDPKHVRLGRMNAGAPVLDTHSAYRVGSVLGVVEVAWLDGKEGRARVRFSERAEVEPVWRDVKSGILRSVSVGYAVHQWNVRKATQESLERRTAVDWEPFELSLVPVPADAGAGVRNWESEAQGARECEMSEQGQDMEMRAGAPAPAEPSAAEIRAAERRRVADIVELCRAHGVDGERQTQWITEDVSVDAVRKCILDELRARTASTHTSPVRVGDATRDGQMRRDMSDALLVRLGSKVEGDGFRHFAGTDLTRLAARVLEVGGVNTNALSKHEIAQRALATSDFANVLYVVGEKMVRQGYATMPMAHRTAFRRTTAADFRAKNRPVVAAGMSLERVPESGVIPRRDAKTEMASYAIDTYAGIIPITRKLIIDDDIDLLGSIARQRGRAAAETERDIVWSLILSNPTAPDGVRLFAAGHKNTVAAAAGATVDGAKLAAARLAMRTATAPDGKKVGASPRYIICGPTTETAWEQLLSDRFVPSTATGVVPASLRSVEVLVEPAIENDAWYAFADPDQIDTIEYAYLAGAEGPRLEQRNGFDVEGIELKVALDFGAGVIDHRGAYLQAQS